MRAAAAADHIGVGLSTFHRYRKDFPDFPVAIEVTRRCMLFYLDELDAWVASRAAERATAPALAD
ncbi:hypothetical protein B2G74_22215 [Burkholderia sp. A27]|nr:hypothetical protein B2G74_22215 [Burkholderia sp. A27]